MTRLYTEPQLDFCDVLFQPKRTTLNSRSEANVMREYKFKYYPHNISSCGIMASNMATTGTIEMYNALSDYSAITCLHKHYSTKELEQPFFYTNRNRFPFVFASTGLKDDKQKLFDILHSTDIDKVCIDIANGYIPKLLDFVKELREKFPKLLIMAGNVVTGDMTQDLIMAGADIVKVGIGPGSVCTTRLKTGVGRPQLSTILECADAAHGVGGLICADGGCTCSGDIAKAFGAGADFVMLGGMLAGTDEAAGELVNINGKSYKEFYGMSSKKAQEDHFGGMKCYRTSEGREKLIPYIGPVKDVIDDILGGIRSTMTYIGARKLKDIPKCTTFYTVNRQLNNIFDKMEDIK